MLLNLKFWFPNYTDKVTINYSTDIDINLDTQV